MKDTTPLSCIILSCDSHIQKGNSVLHCLYGLMIQDFPTFELILVENSHHKMQGLKGIEEKLRQWNKMRKFPVTWKIINNQQSLGYGQARNKAAKVAQGETLIFIDDDTVVIDKNAFSEISKLAKDFDFGCGAQRLWTKDNSFQKNAVKILQQMEEKSTAEALLEYTAIPFTFNRDTTNSYLLTQTFIANFGFCRKRVFCKASGFINFPGYGFEDDHLLFKLYEQGYLFARLNHIRVVHVNHERNEHQEWNFPYYFAELVKFGYYSFDVYSLLEGKSHVRDSILKPLGVIHYDDRLEASFKKYGDVFPLDLHQHKDKRAAWKDLYQLRKPTFTRLMQRIQSSSDLDDMVKQSEADFDNLGPIFQLAVQENFVDVEPDGTIQPKWHFHFTQTNETKDTLKKIKPKSELNQFPCDDSSRKRRYEFLKQRFPFTEYLSIGFIGDDDLVSTEFASDYWAWPVVVEEDESILNLIRRASSRIKILRADIREFSTLDNLPQVHAFFTDPPYTLYGSLAFIYAGLKLLKLNGEAREVYVILNKTMLGNNFFRIQKILASANIYLTEVITNFSHYQLPKDFDENKRARRLLESMSIDKNALTYSSSSNLYIFETTRPNLSFLKKEIDFNHIYNHYL